MNHWLLADTRAMSDTAVNLDSSIYIKIRENGVTVFQRVFNRLPLTIGRSINSDIPLVQYSWISRQQAVILYDKDGIYIVDLKSSNGLIVDGNQYKRVKVEDGTKVEIGGLTIGFNVSDSGDFKGILPLDQDQNTALYDEDLPPENPKNNSDLTEIIPPEDIYASTRSLKLVPQLSNTGTVVDRATEIVQPVPDQLPPSRRGGQPRRGHAKRSSGLQSRRRTQHRRPLVLKQEFFNTPHQDIEAIPPNARSMESFLLWKGQIIDTKITNRGEVISLGQENTSLHCPTIRPALKIGSFSRFRITINPYPKLGTADITQVGLKNSPSKSLLAPFGSTRKQVLLPTQVYHLQLPHDLQLIVRYAPSPRQLTKKDIVTPDRLFAKTLQKSSLIHFLLLLCVFIIAPQKDGPKVRNLPPRVAKLLVVKKKTPPKPKPPPPKPKVKKKKPPVKVARKKPPKRIKKIIRKPKRVTVKVSKKMRRINKKSHTKRRPKKPTDITKVGALSLFSSLNKKSNMPKMNSMALNLNPNAGGLSANKKASTSSFLGAIKAPGGKLAAGGGVGVRTKGKGVGTGTGYGIQVAGSQKAGNGIIRAQVIGNPKLMKLNATEGLSNRQVMLVVNKYIAKIQGCYESALLDNPGLSGRVEYTWVIRANGKVKSAKVKKSYVRNGGILNNCVIAVIKKMRFPKAKNGHSTQPNIGFPFGRT